MAIFRRLQDFNYRKNMAHATMMSHLTILHYALVNRLDNSVVPHCFSLVSRLATQGFFFWPRVVSDVTAVTEEVGSTGQPSPCDSGCESQRDWLQDLVRFISSPHLPFAGVPNKALRGPPKIDQF